jgi:mono/diheme cytochrome c family protein
MRYLLVLILVAVLSLAAVIGCAYSGWAEVSASGTASAPVRWVLETTRRNAVARRAADIRGPDLSAPALAASGASAVDQMCAGCHGAPGRKPMLGATYMDPKPLDLGDVARQRTPAEVFWVIKHGIRMTGTPAWGPTHSDDQLWALVALLGRLPELSDQGYRQLVMQAEDRGHTHGHAHGPTAAETDAHRHGHDDH